MPFEVGMKYQDTAQRLVCNVFESSSCYINMLREQFLQPVPVTLLCNNDAVPYKISNIPREDIPVVLYV